ncbi:hypothetical protein F5884DRAFT_804550 [Xylogone sp. PMI_703]|nr:hypothetical protein F5884DRAFT_804550 [Xylogone sp. PMI_703]
MGHVPKTFVVLENNPEVMTPLAHDLGLSPSLSFHDVYSVTDPDLLALVPRPVHALLVIIPMTPTWNKMRESEDATISDYIKSGPEEPVIWFKQTIHHACGSIGLLHCVINGSAKAYILPNTTVAKLREDAIPLRMAERAQMLYDSKEFEEAHAKVANLGDTIAPSAEEGDRLGQHFVAFVKGDDGHLYELEGGRKGPLDRGKLEDDEDVLSPNALEKGIGRLIRLESEAGGDLRFSITALCGQ